MSSHAPLQSPQRAAETRPLATTQASAREAPHPEVRPEVAALQRLQDALDRSPTVQRLAQMTQAANHRPVVQRTIDIVDANAGEEDAEDYTSFVEAVLAQPEYAAEAGLRQAQHIHLRVEIARAVDQPAQHATTVLTRVDPPGANGDQWSAVLKAGQDISIRIRIFPSTTDGQGDIMAHLMHEMTLHLSPMLLHLRSLRRDEGNAQEHVTNIIDGNDVQHSNPASWRTYLANAVSAGTALKQAGKLEDGSGLIMSAVNDVMTHTYAENRAGSPQMSDVDRAAVFAEADAIGTQEGQFQAQHPEIWGDEDDDEDEDEDAQSEAEMDQSKK